MVQESADELQEDKLGGELMRIAASQCAFYRAPRARIAPCSQVGKQRWRALSSRFSKGASQRARIFAPGADSRWAYREGGTGARAEVPGSTQYRNGGRREHDSALHQHLARTMGEVSTVRTYCMTCRGVQLHLV